MYARFPCMPPIYSHLAEFSATQPVQVLPCLLNLSLIGIGKGFTLTTPYPNPQAICTRSLVHRRLTRPPFLRFYPHIPQLLRYRELSRAFLWLYIPHASQPISGPLSVTAEFSLQLPVLVSKISFPRAATYTHSAWSKRHEEIDMNVEPQTHGYGLPHTTFFKFVSCHQGR